MAAEGLGPLDCPTCKIPLQWIECNRPDGTKYRAKTCKNSDFIFEIDDPAWRAAWEKWQSEGTTVVPVFVIGKEAVANVDLDKLKLFYDREVLVDNWITKAETPQPDGSQANKPKTKEKK